MQDPFSSNQAFRDAFGLGLQRLLEDEEGLGPYFLVLANATFDPAIQERLRHRLARRFGELAESCRRAFASVNHLHFHLFVRSQPLPVAADCWRHNSGFVTYPALCERFRHVDAAWERIADLHKREISYNLVYLPGVRYCLPRRHQGSYQIPAWSQGQGWYEMSGGGVAFNARDFKRLSSADLRASLAATKDEVGGIPVA
jgi:hypothetical protein